MKALKALFIGAVFLATAFATTAADEKPSSQHWYQVVVAQPSYYAFVCTCTLAESDLSAALSKEEGFIKLENLLYRDNGGKYKDWHDWDSTAESRIYVKAKAVLTFQPLTGDPRKTSDSGNK